MSNSITLKDFLIKYTAIPEKFINEYSEIYDMCDKNSFGIIIIQKNKQVKHYYL